jgi:hypothetical protein
MAAIKGSDTKPELLIRKLLHQRGFRYRLHDRKPLRANKGETIEWLKFTLEGEGERTHGYAFEDTAF